MTHTLHLTDHDDSTLRLIVAQCTCGWKKNATRINEARGKHANHVAAEADWDAIAEILDLGVSAAHNRAIEALARRRGPVS